MPPGAALWQGAVAGTGTAGKEAAVAWQGEWRLTGACRILVPVDWAWDPASVGVHYDRFVAPTQDLEVFLVALDGAEDLPAAIAGLADVDLEAWGRAGELAGVIRVGLEDGGSLCTAHLPAQGVALAGLYRPRGALIFGLKAYDHRRDAEGFAALVRTLDHMLTTLEPL